MAYQNKPSNPALPSADAMTTEVTTSSESLKRQWSMPLPHLPFAAGPNRETRFAD
jgi:hypothetical protein